MVDSNYSMAVATLQVPTRLHQSCKHLTSHLMAHHAELLEPSTQAMGGSTKKLNVSILQNFLYELKMKNINIHCLDELTVPAADLDERKVFAFRRERPKSQT